MKYLIGKKQGMTQIFDEKGSVVPVTLIQAGPVTVTQILTEDKNGYSAVQVGFGKKNLNKPEKGHQKGLVDDEKKGFAVLREFDPGDTELKRGDSLDVSQFEVGDKITVRGTTKGKGFQGVVKRWNFAGGPKTHGQKHTLRTPGSIGSAFPQRVLKGIKMAGHMGVKQKSVLNLKVAYIDKETNTLGVKGSVPGNKGGYVEMLGK
ncbi:MAG: 50S ribosomal protein L3 [Candidatus Spechtbacterales bacterium]|nr:50S ribosomal protein L3 [Candidatus Spechtbacterales bacterium]